MFCKNPDRLLDGDIAAKFFSGILNFPQVSKLLSSEHFSIDGTLIETWASTKSFAPKNGGGPPAGQDKGSHGRNAERDFHGEKRKNDTIPRLPTRTLGCSARVPARRPSSATWDI